MTKPKSDATVISLTLRTTSDLGVAERRGVFRAQHRRRVCFPWISPCYAVCVVPDTAIAPRAVQEGAGAVHSTRQSRNPHTPRTNLREVPAPLDQFFVVRGEGRRPIGGIGRSTSGPMLAPNQARILMPPSPSGTYRQRVGLL